MSIPELTRWGLRYAPRALVGWSKRTRLARVGGGWPSGFSFGAFECRLDEDDRVDMLACATVADGGDAEWRGRRGRERPGIPALFDQWANGSSVIRRSTQAIWLEFDQETGTSARPPFAFLRLADARRKQSPRTSAVIEAMASALGARSLPEGWRLCLRRVEAALPSNGRVLHVAVAPHRASGLRLHLGIVPSSLQTFLRCAGWSGDSRALEDTLAAWRHVERFTGVQLDVGERLQPMIDLEYFFPIGSHLPSDPGWHVLLDFVRRRRLAKPQKLQAALDWMNAADSPQDWPIRLTRELQIKIRIGADGRRSAKCYLGFSPRFTLW